VPEGFDRTEFSHDDRTLPVWRRGEGPGVVVIHEVPGITPAVAAFGRRVADAGFTVAMPELFGTVGKGYGANVVGQLLRACVSREFQVLAAHRSSPITDWLRALARALHEEIGGPGVGAIGMCLTGNFALSLMLDPCLMAPVLSQPSLPFGLGRERRAALHLSPEELAAAKKRTAEGVKILGMRFTADPLCPPERFETLRREFGEQFEAIEIDSSRGNPHGISATAHSVVTKDLVDEAGHPTRAALERVLGFFSEQLRPPANA